MGGSAETKKKGRVTNACRTAWGDTLVVAALLALGHGGLLAVLAPAVLGIVVHRVALARSHKALFCFDNRQRPWSRHPSTRPVPFLAPTLLLLMFPLLLLFLFFVLLIFPLIIVTVTNGAWQKRDGCALDGAAVRREEQVDECSACGRLAAQDLLLLTLCCSCYRVGPRTRDKGRRH